MLLLVLFQLLKTSVSSLGDVVNLLYDNQYKEIIELSNGLKIYYICDKTRISALIDFRIELYDLPSNTGLYNLLQKLLNIPCEQLINNNSGKFYIKTGVPAMSFSYDVHTKFAKEVVKVFYDALYNGVLHKEAIMEKIRFIDNEVNHEPSFKHPLLFYLLQHFLYADEYNFFSWGNEAYFDSYFRNYICKGDLLGEHGFQKFSKNVYFDISEAYHELLIFLLENRLRRFPMSVFITSAFDKWDIVKMFEKYDEKQVDLIKSREKDYKNDGEFEKIKLMPGQEGTVNILIKCPIPDNLHVISFFTEYLKKKLSKTFNNQILFDSFFLVDRFYFLIIVKDYHKFNYDSLADAIYQNKVSSKFLSHDEFTHFFKNGHLLKDDEEVEKYFKKVTTLLNLSILKAMEEWDIGGSSFEYIYNELPANDETLRNNLIYYSLLHEIIVTSPEFFRTTGPMIFLDDLNEFRKHLLDPSNYTSFIIWKQDVLTDRNLIEDFECNFLHLKVSDVVVNKNNMIVLPKYDMTDFKRLDVVTSNHETSSFTLFFKAGKSSEDKVALICVGELLRSYKKHAGKFFSQKLPDITVNLSFQNVVTITILSNSIMFEQDLIIFLTTFNTFSKKEEFLKVFKENFSAFKKDYEITKDMDDCIVINSIESYASIRDVFKRLCTKSLYFGKADRILIDRVKKELRQSCFNFVSEDNFPLLSNVPFLCSRTEGEFPKLHVYFLNKDASTFEQLIKNKILIFLFKDRAENYFYKQIDFEYECKIEFSGLIDFSFIKLKFVTIYSREFLMKEYCRFINDYDSWISNLKAVEFEKLKRILLNSLTNQEPLNISDPTLYMLKWGFVENYSELRPRIENFINELDLDVLKTWLANSLWQNVVLLHEHCDY